MSTEQFLDEFYFVSVTIDTFGCFYGIKQSTKYRVIVGIYMCNGNNF